MTTVISGDTGVSQVQAGSINQDDLAANVVGKGPAFRVYATVATSATPSSSKVAFGSKSFDTASAFDTAASRFQPTVAGYYQFSTRLSFASSSYTTAVSFYKNGVVVSTSLYGTTSVGHSDLLYMNGTTDYMEIFAYSATTQNTGSGEGSVFFSGFLARAA